MTAAARRQREPIRGRFFIEPSDGGWTLGDTFDGGCLEFPTRQKATSYARFARSYLRRHGTVSLYAAPIDLDAAPDADWIARQRNEAGGGHRWADDRPPLSPAAATGANP